jgi:prophage maintenance system killer protein
VDIQHLTAGDILTIYAELGYDSGSVNQGAIDSIIEAVLKLDQYGHSVYPEPITMASAYLTQIVGHLPFPRGNSVAAWAVAQTFLNLNGVKVQASKDDVSYLIDGILDGSCGEGEIVQFILNRAIHDDPPRTASAGW